MKRLLVFIVLLGVAPCVSAEFLGIKQASETVSFFLNKPLDSLYGIPRSPDSVHLFTYADNATAATFQTRSTTFPFSDISIDTLKHFTDTMFVFADAISDIDGAGGYFSLAIEVQLYYDDIPTTTHATVQIISDSLENMLDASKDSSSSAAVLSKNNLDSLQAQDGWVAKEASLLSPTDNIGINWADVTNQTAAVTLSNTTVGTVTTASTVTDGAKEATLAYFDSLMYNGARGMGIWIDASAANTNTVIGTDGTKKNPVSALAAAKTIADNLGATRYYITGRSSLTLAATHEDWEFVGDAWGSMLNLGSQDVDGSYIYNLILTGSKGGTGDIVAENCAVNDLLLMDGYLFHCGIDGANTIAASDDVFLMGCFSMVAGNGTPSWGFGAGICELSVRSYSGGIEIQTMDGNDGCSIETDGQVVVNANCTAPNITVRGNMTLTDNDGGTTWTRDGVFSRQEADLWVWGNNDTTVVDTSLLGEWLSTGINASISQSNMSEIADSVWSASRDALLKSLVVSNSAGDAVQFTSTGGGGDGFQVTGEGTGEGLVAQGGTSGDGFNALGGATAGRGVLFAAAAGNNNGAQFQGFGNNPGLSAIGGTGGNSNGINAVGYGTGHGLNANAVGTGHDIFLANSGTISNGTDDVAMQDDSLIFQGAASGLTVDQIWEYDSANVSGAQAMGTLLKDTSAYQGSASGLTKEDIAETVKDTLEAGTVDMALNTLDVSPSGAGVTAVTVIGNTTGPGMTITGGNDANGMTIAAGGGNRQGVSIAGAGSGDGVRSVGGATGDGLDLRGGITSGHGLFTFAQTSGDGIRAAGAAAGYDIYLASSGTISDGTDDVAMQDDSLIFQGSGASIDYEQVWYGIDTTNVDSSDIGVWIVNNTAATSGSGIRTITYYVVDSSGTDEAVSNITLTVNNESDVFQGQRATTSASGYVTFKLDDGTYIIQGESTVAYKVWHDTIVVSANATDTVWGYNQSITPATDPSLTKCYAYLQGPDGKYLVGAKIVITVDGAKGVDTIGGVILANVIGTRTAVDSGYFEVDLFPSANYSNTTGGKGKYSFNIFYNDVSLFNVTDVTVPASGTLDLSTIITGRE